MVRVSWKEGPKEQEMILVTLNGRNYKLMKIVSVHCSAAVAAAEQA